MRYERFDCKSVHMPVRVDF